MLVAWHVYMTCINVLDLLITLSYLTMYISLYLARTIAKANPTTREGIRIASNERLG